MADVLSEPLIEKGEVVRRGRVHKHKSWVKRNLTFIVLQAITLSIIPASFILGQHQGARECPKLPTDAVSRAGYKLTLKQLDDEFEVRDPANRKFKGLPRPELDDAWDSLIQHMNIRVHPDEARQANYTSVTLNDGSGDMTGMPAVFHSLHCLKTLRRIQFPDYYPEEWEMYKPPAPGGISDHVDHCFDNIRQALMCHGDLALYTNRWIPGRAKPFPEPPSQHICIDWNHMMNWASQRSYQLEERLLQHPDSDTPWDPST
ncbi:hypothetical protein F5Y17DRAFT_414126 [Xylariaceae sp. FL0594]|nr:hypothetical protein F5Y17DRAFT_414126 [Xylariaceae sp. FL0594]